jgi:hypothetical protein
MAKSAARRRSSPRGRFVIRDAASGKNGMRFLSVLFVLVLIGCSAPASPGNTAQASVNDLPAVTVGRQGPVSEVSLTNDSHNDLPARTFSFGQVFRRGDVAVGERVQVMVDGQALPTQFEPKALHADGSVRHAIVTVQLPQMRGKQTLKAILVNNLKAGPAPAEAPGAMVAAPDFQVTLGIVQGSGEKRVVKLDLPAIVAAEAGKKPDYWLNGPLAQERRYTLDVDPRLQVQFDVYTPRQGPSRVDVAFRSDWNDLKAEQDVVYDVAISMRGKTLFSQQGLRQYPFSSWHFLEWSDDAAAPRTAQSLAGLIAAGAVPRYDRTFQIGRQREEVTDLARSLRFKPLSSGTVTLYMPTTGGRFDIGPLPTWAVIDLLDGDAASRRLLLANADASGSVPWHIRERSTKLPLTTDRYPDLWLDTRGHTYAPLAEPFNGEKGTDWDIDDAHQPSLTYLPYLITGLRYYKDELVDQAAFVLLSYNNGYRGGAQGLIDGADPEPWFEQRRGISWSLRTLANAAYAVPHDDPMHDYFEGKLRSNLAYMVHKYVVSGKYRAAGPVEGFVPPTPELATWQMGFFATTVGWVNDMGYADAGRLLGWMSNFLTGLFTSEADGFDPRDAVFNVVVTTDDEKQRPLSSWKAVFEASKLRDKPDKDRDERWSYYGMIMRAAVGSAYAVDHKPRTKQAYDYISKRVDGDTRGGDPTFAIVPP